MKSNINNHSHGYGQAKNILQLENKPYIDKLSVLTILSLGLIIFGVRVHLIDGLAVSMPYWDDWGIGGFLHNHLNNELSTADFFAPVNEHRMLFNRLFSVIVFELNQQQWDPMIMMIINSGIWTLTGMLFIFILKRHQRELNILPIMLLIMAIWLYPISPVNTLWGVQTHNYMMILLGVSGCWFINYTPFSFSWFLGLFSLFLAGLSMAGGSFAAVAVCCVFIVLTLFDSPNRKQHLITLCATSIAALFGLCLIYLQSSSSSTPNETFNLVHSTLTFAKSMSWPNTPNTWPFLIFLTPIIWLFISSIKSNVLSNKLTRFTLCLYLFVVIIALAIAVARAFNGEGPSRRYLEFLALGSIASLIALLLIQTKSNTVIKSLTIVWVLAVFAALPFQVEILRYTLEDRADTIPHQTNNVRKFIYDNDALALNDQPFRHVPFHSGERLAKALVEFEQSDILPYQLQKPESVIDQATQRNSIFRVNNSHLSTSKVIGADYFGAPMLGSYTNQDGMTATGNFESKELLFSRPYILVPSLGFLGLHGLSLTLLNTETGEQRLLIPEKVGMEHGDQWLDNFYRVTPGRYKLIAEDQNAHLWFGFAPPRTVGRLSYLAQQLLERGPLFWQTGLLLLIIVQRKSLLKLFSFSKQQHNH